MVTRSSSAGAALCRAVAGGATCGVLVLGLLEPFALALDDGSLPEGPALAGLELMALVLGAPVGAAVGLFYAIPASLASYANGATSHRDWRRRTWGLVAWLALAAVLHRCVADSVEPTYLDPSPNPSALLAAWFVPAFAATCIMALAVVDERAERWLTRVRSGAVDGFRIEPRPPSLDCDALPPPFAGALPRTGDEILVRIELGSAAASYREYAAPERARAIALV